MDDADTIAELIERIGRLISNAQHADGFKPVQWEALRYLDQANVFSRHPGAMADYLGVTKGSVSQTVSTLEQRGLIKKRTDQRDKRVTRLELTAAARRQLKQNPLHHLAGTAQRLSVKDQRALSEGLQTLLSQHLQQQDRAPFGQCKNCRHLLNQSGSYRCGLLNEPLQPPNIELICAEFEQPA